MRNIIQMIFYRIWRNKAYLFLSVFVTPIVILLAISFSRNMTTSINIAIVGDNEISILENENINISYLKDKPPFSDIMEGKYDAVVTFSDNTYSIETIKNSQVKEAINSLLQGQFYQFNQSSSQRGEISNLTGFIMMFVLLIGVMLYRFYYEEHGTIEKRILSTPISNFQYIMSHYVTVCMMCFLPIFIIISIYKIFIGFDSTISIVSIGSIVLLMSLLGSSLGLFISSIMHSDENAILVGAMTIIITTLLSGSFREITQNSVTLFISKLLPQKYILDYAISLENNQTINIGGIIYVILLSLIFILLALQKKQLCQIKN